MSDKSSGFEVVKGGGVPLTATQRELVGIFVQYLKRLPEPDQDGEVQDETYTSPKEIFGSNRYDVLNRLLGNHFETIYPEWTRKAGATSRFIGDLPDAQGDEFKRLMYHAATPKYLITKRMQQVLERRRQLLSLARDKRRLLDWTRDYERDRAELGLTPDYNLEAIRKPTPIEQRTQATWPAMMQEEGS